MAYLNATISLRNGMSKTLRTVNKDMEKLNKNVMLFNMYSGRMTTGFVGVIPAVTAVNSAVTQTKQKVNEVNEATKRVKKEQDALNNSIKQAQTHTVNWMGSMRSMLVLISSVATIVMLLRNYTDAADTLTNAENRLVYTLGNEAAAQEAMEKIYASSLASRSDYADNLSNVSKMMTLAGDAFQNNIDYAIKFNEVMQESYVLGGATASEMAASMTQLSQALASGILAGDELRSVRENAPAAYKAIEEFAQQLYDTDEALNDLASQGLITSDIIVNGIMASADAMEDATADMKLTYSQMWTMFKTTALKGLQDSLAIMSDNLSYEEYRKFLTKMQGAFSKLGEIIINVAYKAGKAISFIVDNWQTVKQVLKVVIGMYIAYKAVVMGAIFAAKMLNAVHLIQATIMGIVAAAKVVLTGATWANTTATASATTAQWGLNAALYACPLIWIIALILLVATAILVVVAFILKWTGVTESALGVIAGSFAVAGAFIWNSILGLITLIVGIFDFLWNTVATFVNFFGNVFNDPVASIIHLFGDWADTMLGIIETVAGAIDSLLGTDLAGSVSDWRTKLSNWFDDQAEEYGNGTYETIVEQSNLASKLDDYRLDYTDAYSTGYDFGSGLSDWLSSAGEDTTTPLDEWMEDSNSLLNDISDDTSDISDSVDISNEELKYLRDIAEREAINRFTTAEIKVEMNNNNTITDGSDIDGIMNAFGEKLMDELNVAAEGVHY